ncbi:MAG: type II toxin-antitoxin system RelE/ParE family toxin [Polycyclovorans sp.]|nr:type II toxin-antitoxin system RelE/ParE family toxin [Polycyclovorans sp.]
MTRIELAPEITADLDRIVQHLLDHDADLPAERIDAIIAVLDLLASSPLIGRPCRQSLGELIIGRGAQGYVALYHYAPAIDTVFVLGIRSQREAGYGRDFDGDDG